MNDEDRFFEGTTIIVLNWNGSADTVRCLDRLQPSVLRGAKVLVVDNGSTDGSEVLIRDAYPEVLLHQTGANLGYAGGNNAGILIALESGAEYVCVLNNDTLPGVDFLTPLLAAAKPYEGQRAAAVSPVITYPDGQIWFDGAIVDPDTGIARHLRPDEQQHLPGVHNTDLLTGCCILASAAVWHRVGMFDEAYFLIFEDADWSLRARRAGVDLHIVPESELTHLVSQSFQTHANVVGGYYYSRNGVRFCRQHASSGRQLLRFVTSQVVLPCARSLKHRQPSAVKQSAYSLLGLFHGVYGRGGPLSARWMRLKGCP